MVDKYLFYKKVLLIQANTIYWTNSPALPNILQILPVADLLICCVSYIYDPADLVYFKGNFVTCVSVCDLIRTPVVQKQSTGFKKKRLSPLQIKIGLLRICKKDKSKKM